MCFITQPNQSKWYTVTRERQDSTCTVEHKEPPWHAGQVQPNITFKVLAQALKLGTHRSLSRPVNTGFTFDTRVYGPCMITGDAF